MIGRIYKLVSNKTRCVYIGSTIRPLKERLYSHRGIYKQWKRKKYPTYRKVFTIMKHRDVKIIRLEKLEFDSLEELRKREKYWIKKYKKMGMKCINENSAYRLGCGYSERNIKKNINVYDTNVRNVAVPYYYVIKVDISKHQNIHFNYFNILR